MNNGKFELVAGMISILALGGCSEVETKVGSNAAGHTSQGAHGGAIGSAGSGGSSASGAMGGVQASGGATTAGGASSCPSGMEYFVPGCGSGDKIAISSGCYQPCGTGSACSEGWTCAETVINPCVCTDPSQGCCAACGMSQSVCLPNASSDCSNDSYDPRLLGAENSFGMCIQECDYKLTVTARTSSVGCDGASLDVLNWPDQLMRSNHGLLSSLAHDLVRTLAANLNNIGLLDIYGCPDCADGGASKLSLIRSGATSTHTYEYTKPPVVLEAADAFVQSLIQALNTCQSNAYVTVSPECVPRTTTP